MFLTHIFILGLDCFHFTGFYGFSNLNNPEQSWDLLRRVGNLIHDDWIIGKDFNSILNGGEKISGRQKSKVAIDKFENVFDELALVDIKTNKGWFTWSNNRDGPDFVKEHLDRFVCQLRG